MTKMTEEERILTNELQKAAMREYDLRKQNKQLSIDMALFIAVVAGAVLACAFGWI